MRVPKEVYMPRAARLRGIHGADGWLAPNSFGLRARPMAFHFHQHRCRARSVLLLLFFGMHCTKVSTLVSFVVLEFLKNILERKESHLTSSRSDVGFIPDQSRHGVEFIKDMIVKSGQAFINKVPFLPMSL